MGSLNQQINYRALPQAEKYLLKENKKEDAKALFFIQQAMEESYFPKVAAVTRGKQAWEVTKLTLAIWWKPLQISKHFQSQGITGPPYRLLVGNLLEFTKLLNEATSKPMKLTHDIAARVQPYYPWWSKIYGSTFLMWIGPIPTLVVGASELAKNALGDMKNSYGKPKWDAVLKELFGGGLVMLDGDKWAHHRQIINPSFHADKLKDMASGMMESTTHMLEKWEKIVKNGEKEMDVAPEFKALTSDIIARTAFGSSYLQGNHIFDLLSQQISLTCQDYAKLLFPCYRFLPFKRNRECWRLNKEIKSALKDLIMKREMSGTNTTQGYGNDLLGSMMNTIQEMRSSKMNGGLTTEEIIPECKTFFIAGQETTSNHLTYAIVLLAMYPEWQEKARSEIQEICGNSHPQFETINKLKTLGMILNEVIRLYPPAVAYMREIHKDTTLGGIAIPKGTQILIPTLSLNHDTSLWGDDADEFNPERFSQGIANATKDDSTVFIPFGYGLRTCVGKNYAMLESKVVLAMILQRFSFVLSPGYIHAPTTLLTIFPQHGAPIIFQKL
ncbi:cytochrome P450 734A1-like [Cryptomeria japonica]|uniref:cytochrome P450 734A1-like n=1 Tax=Cryptomeria japonica TaxID=3369 RepID=UPI0025AC3B60|nr:cytochrome P450 734A1-like [Cryptomeria japonica]